MIDKPLKKMIPLGRMVRVDAAAAAVAPYLLSPETSFINCTDYALDGGEAQL